MSQAGTPYRKRERLYDRRMPGPSRPLPRVGARARLNYFGGDSEAATIRAVRDDGRRLLVRGEDGAEQEFVLSPKTARFVLADDPHGPRLELLS